MEMVGFLDQLAKDKAAHPADDIVSQLVAAEVEGRPLTAGELVTFTMSLVVAGNETTRHLMSCSLMELAARPDDRAAIYADADRIPGAVEECLRWVTPIQQFARTVTEDTEVSGVPVSEGDYLVMLYASGNRDEAAFGPMAAAVRPGSCARRSQPRVRLRPASLPRGRAGSTGDTCALRGAGRTRRHLHPSRRRGVPPVEPGPRTPTPSRSSSTERRTPDHRPDQRSSSMEDRITPELYLEMTSIPPDAYAAERVPDVLRLPAVTRATWWENVQPGRTDLPRKLPEFSLLGVYEVDDGFTAPEPPNGITGYHFRHYPRPGQGRLTGKPTIGLSLVLISPRQPETRRRCATGATSCTSATSPRSRCPGIR